MNLMIELLAASREADLLRESEERRLKSLVTACRRRFFGLLRIGPACETRATY